MKWLETLWDYLNLITYLIMTELLSIGAGECHAMYNLLRSFKDGLVSRDAIDTTLTAYNNACVNMRSEVRNSLISAYIDDGKESWATRRVSRAILGGKVASLQP
jgi:hypothetical protein